MDQRRVTTLASDKADYPPGTEAVLTGAGFMPGEMVTLLVEHADGTPQTGHGHEPWTVNANRLGRFVTSWHVCEDDCVGSTLRATADGLSSGLHARTTFTDNHECGDGVVTAVTPVGGECVAFTPAQGNGPDNYEVQEGGTYVMTIEGVTECTGDTITVFVQSSVTGNFCFNATGGEGTYMGMFTMPDAACFTMPISYKCGANAPCTHPGSFAAQGPMSGCGGVHLRAANFDEGCGLLGSDEVCDEICEVPITLGFETDGCGDPTWMNHGLDLESLGPECAFTCPTISSGPGNGGGTGNGNAGMAIFDSETTGGGDPDLQGPPPGQGNVLMVQNNNNAVFALKTGVNGPDTYDNPNDDPDGGDLTFDFCGPVDVQSIDLIDIDEPTPEQDTIVVLTDMNGLTRTYLVPGGWTSEGGVGTLDLDGGDQIGPGGATATVFTVLGYDGTLVVQVKVTFGSSGALDNLAWCP